MKKWKLNWGTALAVVLTLFAITMAYTMYLATQQRFDLVTTNYYQKEQEFEESLKAKQKALDLDENCQLTLEKGQVKIIFPNQLSGLKANAEVLMYCQGDAQNDFVLHQKNWIVKDILLTSSKLSSGKWIAKINLESGGEKYYFDPEIILP